MQLAKRDNKLVMALFTGTDWCSFCIKLENEVFGTPEFRKWSDENVVPLMLDFPKTTKLDPALSAQNQKLKLKYKNYVSGYPTVLFLDPQGTVVAKMGYARGGPENWISKAEERLSQ
jgi:protein disulfide-isomerase